MSHFAFEFFFGLKIFLTFIFIVTHVHPAKKSHNQVGNSYICGVFNKGFNRWFVLMCSFLTVET